MSHPLDGCRAKILRADKHLQELDAQREMWVAGVPYDLAEKSDTKPNAFYWQVMELDPPPLERLGLILGDYVHSLRSALDHLVWRLVETANRHQVPKNKWSEIYFPVVTTSLAEFWGKEPLRYLTVEQVTYIEGFQPYRAGNYPGPLRDLQFFWNADKHRIVIPVVISTHPRGANLRVE